MKRTPLILLILILLAFTAVIFVACIAAPPPDRATVVSVQIANFEQLDYFLNEPLNIENAQILVLLSDNSTRTLPITPAMISGFNSSIAGEQVITITHQTASAQLTVTVHPNPIERVDIVDIDGEVVEPWVPTPLGEMPNLENFRLRVTFDNGSHSFRVIADSWISGYNSTFGAGEHTATITFSGFMVNFTVDVVEPALMRVAVYTRERPTINTYFVQQNQNTGLMPYGMVMTLYFWDGFKTCICEICDKCEFEVSTDECVLCPCTLISQKVPLTIFNLDDFVFSYDFTTARQNSRVDVVYLFGGEEFETSFFVTVRVANAVSMTITQNPLTHGITNPLFEAGACSEACDETCGEENCYWLVAPARVFGLTSASILQGNRINWATGFATVRFEDATEITNISLADTRISGIRLGGNEIIDYDKTGTYNLRLTFGITGWHVNFTVTVQPRAPRTVLVEKTDNITHLDLASGTHREYNHGDSVDVFQAVYNVMFNNGEFMFFNVVNEVDHKREQAPVSTWPFITRAMVIDSELVVVNDGSNLFDVKIYFESANPAVITVRAKPLTVNSFTFSEPSRNFYPRGQSVANMSVSTLNMSHAVLWAQLSNGTSKNLLFNNTEVRAVVLRGNIADNYGGDINVLTVSALADVGVYTVRLHFYDKMVSFLITAQPVESVVVSMQPTTVINDNRFLNLAAVAAAGINFAVQREVGTASFTLGDQHIFRYDAAAKELWVRFEGFVYLLPIDIVGVQPRAMTLVSAPNQTTYYVTDLNAPIVLNLAGMLVDVHFNDGTVQQFSSFGDARWSFNVLGTDFTREVAVSLSSLIGRLSFTFNIWVAQDSVTSIAICDTSLPTGLLLVARGNDINTQGINLVVTYENQTEPKIVPLLRGYTDFNPQARVFTSHIWVWVPNGSGGGEYAWQGVGEIFTRNVTVTFGGKTTSFAVEITTNVELNRIEVVTPPNALANLPEGVNPNFAGGFIRRFFREVGDVTGATETWDLLPLNDASVFITGYNPSVLAGLAATTRSAPQTLNVAHGGKNATFAITTHRRLDAPRVIGYNNVIYVYGDDNLIEPRFDLDIDGFDLNHFKTPNLTVFWRLAGVANTVPWTQIFGESDMPTLPGVYTIRTVIEGNEYFVASPTETDIMITPRQITVRANPATRMYGPNETEPWLTYTIENAVTGDIIAISVQRQSGSNVGVYDIIPSAVTPSAANNNDRYTFTFVKGVFTITPITLTASNNIVFNLPHNPVYDGNAKPVAVTYWASGTTVTIQQSNIQYFRIITSTVGEPEWQFINGTDGLMGVAITGAPTAVGNYAARISQNYTVPEGMRFREFSILTP